MTDHLYVKQGDEWGEYLSSLGWRFVRTGSGVGLAILPTFLGKLCKVQRPHELTPQIVTEIEQVCKEHKVGLLKVEPGFGQDPILLTSRGYVLSDSPLSPPSSLYVDLNKSKEELWKALSRSGKYGVNRAKREGCSIEFIKNPTDTLLKDYSQTLKVTEKRGKFKTQSYKELLYLRNAFKDRAYLSLVTTKDGVAGGKFYVGWEHVVTYINGGTTDSGLKSRAGYALFWEAFEYFKDAGYTLFDLEGSYDKRFPVFTKNWQGFTEFKMKFGVYAIEYSGAYTKAFSPIMKFLAPLI
jgi:lipid II:glycine glycyltransferase (peptidoglycan interpeptide bridge formation enzyme)